MVPISLSEARPRRSAEKTFATRCRICDEVRPRLLRNGECPHFSFLFLNAPAIGPSCAKSQNFPRCNRQRQPDTVMKILPTLMVAALMTAGSAFAASDAPTAMPAAATPVAKHTPSTAHCEKVAHEKKLKGDEEKQFVKDCKAGKKA